MEARNIIKCLRRNEISNPHLYAFTAITGIAVVHEVPDQDKFLKEMYSILKPDRTFFIVEPAFHVSMKKFEETVNKAVAIGFNQVKRPGMILSKAVVLKKYK